MLARLWSALDNPVQGRGMNHFDGSHPDSQATGSRERGSDSLRKAIQARARETRTMTDSSDADSLRDPTEYCASDR
jgi:hypothetical protein